MLQVFIYVTLWHTHTHTHGRKSTDLLSLCPYNTLFVSSYLIYFQRFLRQFLLTAFYGRLGGQKVDDRLRHVTAKLTSVGFWRGRGRGCTHGNEQLSAGGAGIGTSGFTRTHSQSEVSWWMDCTIHGTGTKWLVERQRKRWRRGPTYRASKTGFGCGHLKYPWNVLEGRVQRSRTVEDWKVLSQRSFSVKD